jgi:hypothetical protein
VKRRKLSFVLYQGAAQSRKTLALQKLFSSKVHAIIIRRKNGNQLQL